MAGQSQKAVIDKSQEPHLGRVDVGHGEVEDDKLGANLESHVGHHKGVV